jgi:hypothetical protein
MEAPAQDYLLAPVLGVQPKAVQVFTTMVQLNLKGAFRTKRLQLQRIGVTPV